MFIYNFYLSNTQPFEEVIACNLTLRKKTPLKGFIDLFN